MTILGYLKLKQSFNFVVTLDYIVLARRKHKETLKENKSNT